MNSTPSRWYGRRYCAMLAGTAPHSSVAASPSICPYAPNLNLRMHSEGPGDSHPTFDPAQPLMQGSTQRR